LSFTKSKQFIQSKSSEESSHGSARSDFERDDDDPLSIRSLSITSLGIIFGSYSSILLAPSLLLKD